MMAMLMDGAELRDLVNVQIYQMDKMAAEAKEREEKQGAVFAQIERLLTSIYQQR